MKQTLRAVDIALPSQIKQNGGRRHFSLPLYHSEILKAQL
jgi:hypothetical protein